MKVFTATLLLLPALVNAQNFQNMSEADMQKMMADMQKVQACMAGIDQSRLQQFEQRAKQMETKVDALCAAGKRDQAQDEAMAFYEEVSAEPEMKKMQACGKMMEGSMQNIPGMPHSPTAMVEPHKDEHICDN